MYNFKSITHKLLLQFKLQIFTNAMNWKDNKNKNEEMLEQHQSLKVVDSPPLCQSIRS